MFDWNSALMLAQEGEAAAAGIGIFIFACYGIACLIGLASFAFCIWMLIDCIKNEPAEGNDKIVWILVIVFLGAIGGAIYYFVRRPQRIQQYGR